MSEPRPEVINTAIAAMQLVLLALIESHPDKPILLGALDRIAEESDSAAKAAGGPGISPALREALGVYRARLTS